MSSINVKKGKENRPKINIMYTKCGKLLLIKFKIWRAAFFKLLPLRSSGMDFRFPDITETWWTDAFAMTHRSTCNCYKIRGLIDKFVSFFQRIIIYGWIYTIFCHYQQQSVVNWNDTLKCKIPQSCDVTMTLMTSHVGNVVVKTEEDRCGWCTLSGYKCYSTSAIIVKFSDNICM